MKHSAAKLIGVVGLLVAATATGTSFAQAPQSAPPAPGGQQQAPNTCQSKGGGPSTSDTTSPIATGDPYGPVALVVDSLSKVCLTDDQRGAIEQLGREVRPKEEVVANAHHALVTTLAEDVRSDNFDDAALKSKVDDVVKARKDSSPTLRKALEDLHGILDSGQRAQFVDAIDARLDHMKNASKSWADKLATDLGLSDEQKTRVKDVLDTTKSDLESDRDRVKAVFDAFKGDQFNVDQIAPESDVETRVRARTESMVRCAREIAAILTADQRSKLADKIESKAEKNEAGTHPSGGTQGTGTPNTGAPNSGTPNVGTPNMGAPGVGAPGMGGPGTGTTYPQGTGTPGGDLNRNQQYQFIGGYGFGPIGGWGYGGLGYGAGYGTYQSTTYVGGYPFIGGWGPGIW